MIRKGWTFILGATGALLALAAAAQDTAVGQASGPDERLARILERTSAYCARLERAALDFTCIEKILEETFTPPEIRPDTAVDTNVSTGRLSYSYQNLKRSYRNTYVYDYQFVRKDTRKTEKRILIQENGRKKKVEDAELSTLSVRVENALFGPIGLLGEQWQAKHDYKIIGEETQKGKKVVVIEAVPKPSLDGPHCYGRIWVQEEDASILKISWEQTSVGNFALVEQTARSLDAEPRLTSVTEFGVLKNGIRFPSKDTTEEAYELKGEKKPFVKSLTTIRYTDYKFFTVETEVKY